MRSHVVIKYLISPFIHISHLFLLPFANDKEGKVRRGMHGNMRYNLSCDMTDGPIQSKLVAQKLGILL